MSENQQFMSTADAAALYRRSRDYVSRLARTGEVTARRTGKLWEVELTSLAAFIEEQERAKKQRAADLVEQRKREYAQAQGLERMESVATPQAAPVEAPKPKRKAVRSRKPRSIVKPVVEHVAHIAPQMTAATMHMPSVLWKAVDKRAAHSAHIATSFYTVSPFVDFAHRMFALAAAVIIVFGAYGVMNPAFASYAFEKLETHGSVLARAVYAGTNSALNIADRGTDVLNTALLDPYALDDAARDAADDISNIQVASAGSAISDPAYEQFHNELSRGLSVVSRVIVEAFGLDPKTY